MYETNPSIMPPTILHEPPTLDSFTPISEHESKTPSTFFGAKPILHYHSTSLRVVVSSSQIDALPIFTADNVADKNRASSIVELAEAYVTSELVQNLIAH